MSGGLLGVIGLQYAFEALAVLFCCFLLAIGMGSLTFFWLRNRMSPSSDPRMRAQAEGTALVCSALAAFVFVIGFHGLASLVWE